MVIDPTLLAEYTLKMIPGTGILNTINPNATYNNDDGADVSSSSNNATASETGSSNSSLASTMNSSGNNESGSDTEEQPTAKKPRLSAPPDTDECIPMDQGHDQEQTNVDEEKLANNSLNVGAAGSNDGAFERKLKEMTEELKEKACVIERLTHENQVLIEENAQLKKCLEEKIDHISKVEAAQSKTPHEIDRAAFIESAKKMKFCVACNAERATDMLHFCDVDCQKVYL